MDRVGRTLAELIGRWLLAAVGWGLWLISIRMPLRGRALVETYPEVWRMLTNPSRWRSWLEVAWVVSLFVLATIAGAASPVLMVLNYRSPAGAARLRFSGWFLLSMVPVVVFLMRRHGLTIPSIWLFGLAHVLVTAAIVRWPGEKTLPASRGFEVIVPDQLHRP